MVALQVPRASAWVLLLAACGGARGVASAEDGGSSPGTVAFKTAVSTGVHVGSGLGSSATVVAARSGQQTGETAKAPSITQAVLASNPSLSVTSSTASSDVADTTAAASTASLQALRPASPPATHRSSPRPATSKAQPSKATTSRARPTSTIAPTRESSLQPSPNIQFSSYSSAEVDPAETGASAAPSSALSSALATASVLLASEAPASASSSATSFVAGSAPSDTTAGAALSTLSAFDSATVPASASDVATSSPTSLPTAATTAITVSSSWLPLGPADLPGTSTSSSTTAPTTTPIPSTKPHPVTGVVVALVLLGLVILSGLFFLGPITYRALACRLPAWLTGSQPSSSNSNSVHDEGQWVRRTGPGSPRSSLEEEIAAVRAGSPVGAAGSPARSVGRGLPTIAEERAARPVLPALNFQPPSVRSRSRSLVNRSQESVGVNGPDNWARGPGGGEDSPKSVRSVASSRTHNSAGTGESVLSVAALRAAFPFRPAPTASSEHGVIIEMPTSTNTTRSSRAASGSASRGSPPSTAASTAPGAGEGSPQSFPATPSLRNDSNQNIAAAPPESVSVTIPVSASIQSVSPSITTSADLECSTIVTINPAPARESPALLQSAHFDPDLHSSVVSSLLMARAGSSPGMGKRSSFSSEEDARSVYSCHTGLSPQIGVALGSPYAGFEGFGAGPARSSNLSLNGAARANSAVHGASWRAGSIVTERASSPELLPIPQGKVPVLARSIAMQRQLEDQGHTRWLTPEPNSSQPLSSFASRSGSGQGDEYETATEGTPGGSDAARDGSLRGSGSSWGRKVYGVFRAEEPVTPEIGFGGFVRDEGED